MGPSYNWRSSVKDLRRVLRYEDVLSRVGKKMLQTGTRIAIPAGFAAVGAFAGGQGQEGINPIDALYLPGIASLGLIASGLTCMVVPKLFTSKKRAVAEAQGMNLMADYKGNRRETYVEHVWDHVFSYESELVYTKEDMQAEEERIKDASCVMNETLEEVFNRDQELADCFGVGTKGDLDGIVSAMHHQKPLSEGIEKSKQGFLISAGYSLSHAHSQNKERSLAGYDLSLLEDWMSGAFFHESDNKLRQQFEGNILLTQARKDIKKGKVSKEYASPLLSEKLAHTYQQFWSWMINRDVACRVADEISDLYGRYNIRVNAQALLWPGDETCHIFTKHPGLPEDIVTARKRVIHGVFGNTIEEAESMLDRMTFYAFRRATKMRTLYDHEYCLGELRTSYLNDVKQHECEEEVFSMHQNFVEKRKEEMGQFDNLIASSFSYLNKNDNKESLRSARLSFHINYNHLKDNVLKNSNSSLQEIEKTVEEVTQESTQHLFKRRLLATRMHHQLTVLHKKEYMALLRELAY